MSTRAPPPPNIRSENSRPSYPSSPPSTPSPIPVRRVRRKPLHPLADESEDGYSSHPSIYSASPVDSTSSSSNGFSPKSIGSDGFSKRKSATTGIFEQDVEDRGAAAPAVVGRDGAYSVFSGVDLLDTISEHKSNSAHSDAGAGLLVGGGRSGDQEIEECHFWFDSSDDEYEPNRAFYYDYASPTQPLHPSQSQSMPAHDTNPLLAPPHSHYQSSSVPLVTNYFSRSPPSSQYQLSPSQLPRQTFRPPTSMNYSYGTNLLAHPFHRAPMMAQRSSDDRLVDYDARTPDEIGSPNNRSRASLVDRLGDGGSWGRVFRGFCLVCCCMMVSETDGSSVSARRRRV